MTDVANRLKDQPPYKDDKGEVTDVKPEEAPAEPKVEGAEEEAPPKTTYDKEEETKKRTTEQFDKLKESNKKLKEELDAKKAEARKLAEEGPIASLTPEEKIPQYDWGKMLTNQPPPAQMYPNMSQKQVKDVFEGLVDDQGFVNTDLLKETLDSANKRAEKAEMETQRLRQEVNTRLRSMDDFQRSREAKRVHKKYTELDPSSEDFNPTYFEAVRDKMVADLAKGYPEDFMGAAKSLYPRYTMKKKEKKAQEEQQEAIAQINATGTESPGGRREFGDHETLVKAVQAGTKGALAERLKRSGY